MNLKSILNLLGILLGIFSISFLPPLALTFIYQEDGGESFFIFLFIFISFWWVDVVHVKTRRSHT